MGVDEVARHLIRCSSRPPDCPSHTRRPDCTQTDSSFGGAFDLPDDFVARELSESTPPVRVESAA